MENKLKNILFILIGICLIVSLSSCSAIVNEGESVTITEEKVTLQSGDTHQLEAKVSPSNTTNAEIYWYSSNETVATVDVNTGKVTAIKDGNTKINAKAKMV